MKKILAIILALVVGFFIIKFALWILKVAFVLSLNLVGILLVLAVAGPIYLLIRKALTK